MQTTIVLFRGINVGGNNLLKMSELCAFLYDSGYQNVQSYIQSGNIVLQSRERPCATELASSIEKQFGFKPAVMSLSDIEFIEVCNNNPYKNGQGKFVHFYFCNQSPTLDNDAIEKIIAKDEEYQLVGKVFYLHAPSGIGRSKLVANIEKYLGISATGRNLNTINKLLKMIQ